VTLFGWDASDNDWNRGPMDLGAARNAGISWLTHKATEGTSVVHQHYGEVLRRGRDAGIPVLGAYHVVRTGDTMAEVKYFLARLDRETPWWRDWPDWVLQVDLEKWAYDSVSPATGMRFTDELRAAVPEREPVLYASRGQYGNDLSGSTAPLWNAAYPSRLAGSFVGLYARAGGGTGIGWTPYSGRKAIMWQYTDNATIGSQSGCDANAFEGTIDQLKAAVRGSAHPEADVNLSDPVGNTKSAATAGNRSVEQVLGDLENLRSVLYGELPVPPNTPLEKLLALSDHLAVTATVDQGALTNAVQQAVNAVKGTIAFQVPD
jgi:GH25 family lysozyme M1 (1,4-beta-N-acetylmuramidase)